ncbi:MAG: hypothetical protein QXU64_02140 [Thermofilaceae archaeon]
MKLKRLAALLALLAAALVAVAQQQYNVSITASVAPEARWTVTPLPVFTLSSVIAPLASFSVTPLPVFTLSSVLSPVYSVALSMYVRLPRWNGGYAVFDTSGPVRLGRLFWVGGVRLEPMWGEVTLSFTSPGEVLAVGACSVSGSTVRVWGSCLVGEPVYAAFSVVDPQGFMKLGVAIQVNGTQVEPGVLYKYLGASRLVISLLGARVGSVYVNGTRVGVGLGSYTLPLENATVFLVRLVARGRLTVTVSRVEVAWSSGGYARLKVSGAVKDADYNAPVPGATVKLYSDGAYYDYAVTRDDGTFLIDTLVRAPKRQLNISLTAHHDDYETASVSATATLPERSAWPTGALSTATLLAGTALAVATVAALAALARVKGAAKRRR